MIWILDLVGEERTVEPILELEEEISLGNFELLIRMLLAIHRTKLTIT